MTDWRLKAGILIRECGHKSPTSLCKLANNGVLKSVYHVTGRIHSYHATLALWCFGGSQKSRARLIKTYGWRRWEVVS